VKILKAVGDFIYDFVIGDDWKIACSVVASLFVVWILIVGTPLSDHVVAVIGAFVVLTAFVGALLIDVRRT
jgi:hypothetical protein